MIKFELWLTLLIAAILSIGAIGWVRNIVQIMHMLHDPITGMFIIKCCGVVMAPLGAVLGWL